MADPKEYFQDDDFSGKVKKIIWEDPSIPAKFSPYMGNETAWILPRLSYTCSDEDTEDKIPVPPQELWDGHWASIDDYIASGQRHFDKMMDIIDASAFSLEQKGRILDFGCGTGRILRCFRRIINRYQVWGVDIRAKHILWSNEHLCPPFKFATVTTFPHLPFEDNYFDLIYAGSVFTHISELAEAWLLELRRILRPDGRCYITVRDNHSLQILLSSPPSHWLHGTPMHQKLLALENEKHFMASGFSMIVIFRDPDQAQVFYDTDFLRKTWGTFFKILSITPEAFGYQTAVLLSK